MSPSRALWIASALLVGALAACGHGASSGPSASPSPAATTRPDSQGLTDAQVEALYRARTDSARQQFTAADAHFMRGMIGHHSQALVMAALAPSHGASPTIRTLTARITNSQRDEIALMEKWLRDRDQAVPEVTISGIDMTITGVDHEMMMPGMMPGLLTQAQLGELDAARGPDFDRLFLTFMIQHHQGAVTMVHDLFATDGAAQDGAAFKLASDIQVDQTTEIARMERMLSEMRGLLDSDGR